MAKNTQEAEVIVTLNGQAAKRAIKEMEQEYERLTKAALEAHKAGNDALGKELDAQAEKLTRDIQITRRETKKFADVMKNINGASLKELRSAAKQLQSEINKLTPGTHAFIAKSKQLQEVNTRIRQLTNEFKGLVVEEKQATFSLKGLADGFNKYFGMVTAGIAAVTGLSMAFRKSAEDAAKLDDTYSDVMKTTGLLHDEVADLDKELMKIDTRTSREQLLLLARDAGKLGIQGKEDILGFVRAADQIQVALGEDLGEGAIKNLGKIADVFGLTKEMGIEKSLLSIASAVNALGQASTASEAYLVDFTQRLAGVGAMAGLSVQDILGFASGLDQSAMKVEMAATAFQKFLMSMYEEPAKFAKYAGMQVEEFTELLKTNANEAITVVMKAMNGQDGFAAMVPVFNEMGLDGARAVGVLSAMTQNLEAVTESQRLANVEFAKGTSVTEEYNTKNNNMQAQLEKARKEFQNASIALGQSLNPIMLKSTKLTTHLIKALATYGKEMGTAAIAIATVTLAIKRQAVAQTGLNVVQKVGNTLRATANTIIWAARTAIFRLIGATEAATIAQQQLNAVMSASVIGVVALAIGGLTAAITHWVKKQREAAETTDYLAEAEKRANEEYAEQAGKVRALTSIVENNNIALGERKKALNELKSIIPGYHADLTEEGRLINSNKEAIDEYCSSLRQRLRLEARKEQLLEIEKQIAALEDQKADAQERQYKALKESGGDTTEIRETHSFWRGQQFTYTDYGKARKDESDAQKQIDDLEKQAEKFGQRAAELSKKIVDDTRAVIEEEQNKSNAILTQAQFDYLEDRYDKLTKKEKAMVDAGYATLSAEDSKALKARYDKLMKADDKANQKAYDARIKQIEENQRREENALKESLKSNEITRAEYNARMNLIVMQGLQQRIDAAKQFGQDATKYTSQLLDEEIKLIGAGVEEVKEFLVEDFSQPAIDIQANEQFWDEIYGKREEIVANIQDNSLKTEYDKEMMWLKKLHQYKLLSEEEFEKAKLQTKLKYAQQYAEQANSIAAEASNFVAALKEAESAQLEAEYQRQLTAAGDNAEERERIEAEHEQKKLDLQKKYADTEMAVNIAKTIANGAVAAIKAYADAGPVAGAILAALIAATTAAEVATIIAQRNAIKNTTISNASVASSSSTGSTTQTGTRTITGYREGGYTKRATSDDAVVDVVHANEWVAPAWMVRKNPTVFADLEQYRVTLGRSRKKLGKGFADGGFTGQTNNGIATSITKQDILDAIKEGAKKGVKEGLQGEYVKAIVQYGDIMIAKEKHDNFKKQTSR